MRLTLRQLQIFVAIASAGSTAAAARSIALSQSATSAALAELENLLDTRLFDRIGKRLLLNDRGRVLLPQAKQLLSLAHETESLFYGDSSGIRQVLVGASTTIGTYMLPQLIADYAKVHSDVVPRVRIANTANVAEAVANYDAEIGFIEGPCHVAGLRLEPWIQDELIIVASPAHELAMQKRKLSIAALAHAKWLLREPGSGTREAVESALLPHLHSLIEAGEFSSSEAIKHACAAGLGLACLSHWVVADLLEQGRLVQLKTSLPPFHRMLYLIYARGKILSPSLKAFRNYCHVWSRA